MPFPERAGSFVSCRTRLGRGPIRLCYGASLRNTPCLAKRRIVTKIETIRDGKRVPFAAWRSRNRASCFPTPSAASLAAVSRFGRDVTSCLIIHLSVFRKWPQAAQR